ncbi:maleylpyruvate isomerase N-terminal domain-containing protein [Frankia sp. AgKG'84/4]|uniref:maleylpyruvate isomerase N-terminal domain-containing protein n=1 Tax=Frankia sp. AgKG'84/4 TaxID=573490 RepID=UPI00200EDA02|nr:maleylpyruvate isomerase N-terminal domain-containing protein [Frankia sp. AgKG'84/4]MCL9795460.1 DinB family protein [Frankia sp. AgKG'84/4]
MGECAGLAGASPPARGTGSLAAVLAAALAVRPAAPGTRAAVGVAPAAAPPPYGSRVSVLDRLLAGWTVRELIAHLFAVDGLVLAAVSGDADAPPDTDAVSRTHSVLAEATAWSPREVRRRWFDRAERLSDGDDTVTTPASRRTSRCR